MKISNLIIYDDINKDLLHWSIEFIAYKLSSQAKRNEDIENEDLKNLKDNILASINIDDLKDNANKAVQNGFKSLSKSITGTIGFYSYVIEQTYSIKNINHKIALNYKLSLELSESTKQNYIKVLKEFITFIENSNEDNYIFNIQFNDLVIKNYKKQDISYLNKNQFVEFNNILDTFEYENEYIKARDILIIRFIMLCGLNEKDLLGLILDKNIIFNNNELYLSLENRINRFDIPKIHFTKYLSTYIELKDKSTTLFYDIDKKYINALIKKILDSSNIETQTTDIKMLIKSLAIFLYSTRVDEQQIVLNSIQELLGHERLSYTKELIGFHDKDLSTITNVLSNLQSDLQEEILEETAIEINEENTEEINQEEDHHFNPEDLSVTNTEELQELINSIGHNVPMNKIQMITSLEVAYKRNKVDEACMNMGLSYFNQEELKISYKNNLGSIYNFLVYSYDFKIKRNKALIVKLIKEATLNELSFYIRDNKQVFVDIEKLVKLLKANNISIKEKEFINIGNVISKYDDGRHRNQKFKTINGLKKWLEIYIPCSIERISIEKINNKYQVSCSFPISIPYNIHKIKDLEVELVNIDTNLHMYKKKYEITNYKEKEERRIRLEFYRLTKLLGK